MSETKKYAVYKGKPIVRCGNEIYYGSMQDKYIIHMVIQGEQEVAGVNVPTNVLVQLMYTDPQIRIKDRIVKVSEKAGLLKALEISEVWLNKALAGK